MTSVSVVIPCFNARRWIGQTLESVFAQGLPDVEVIVVDDGSVDGSGQYVAEAFPSVRLVCQHNGGPSRARNVGTQLAHGEFIQYLDADDLLAPGKLEAQLEVLERSAADIAYGDWRELRATPNGCPVPGRLVARCIAGDATLALFTDFWCPPAAYVFRRAIVDSVGGWDERQRVIEDVRFMLECALHGAAFVYCPGVAAFYRKHDGDSLSTRDQTAFTRGCMRNAVSVEAWWIRRGGLDDLHTAALLQAYGGVARASFGRDEATFEAAYSALERLDPGYRPRHPWHLAVASRLVGYRSAEAIAVRYRRAKQTLRNAVRVADR